MSTEIGRPPSSPAHASPDPDGDPPDDLGRDEDNGLGGGQLARHPQSDGDRRVEQATGDVPEDRDHDEEHEPMREGDGDEPIAAAVHRCDD